MLACRSMPGYHSRLSPIRSMAVSWGMLLMPIPSACRLMPVRPRERVAFSQVSTFTTSKLTDSSSFSGGTAWVIKMLS